MTDNNNLQYYELTVGFEFPSQSFLMERALIDDYIKATDEDNEIFRKESLVPPMAVAAYAMASLINVITMPSGTLHVSQELEFLKQVNVGDTITCHSRVSRKMERKNMHLMNVDMTVLNQRQDKVLTGRVGFILPEIESGEEK
jgi:acyl dehydratase